MIWYTIITSYINLSKEHFILVDLNMSWLINKDSPFLLVNYQVTLSGSFSFINQTHWAAVQLWCDDSHDLIRVSFSLCLQRSVHSETASHHILFLYVWTPSCCSMVEACLAFCVAGVQPRRVRLQEGRRGPWNVHHQRGETCSCSRRWDHRICCSERREFLWGNKYPQHQRWGLCFLHVLVLIF